MDTKEFFAAVVKMRNLQRKRDRHGGRDPLIRRECSLVEDMIDREIKRVEMVLREKAQPRFFDQPD